MKITAENTNKIVTLNGVPARIWEARTDNGIECILFVVRVAVKDDKDIVEFEQELKKEKAPKPEIQSFPARMVL